MAKQKLANRKADAAKKSESDNNTASEETKVVADQRKEVVVEEKQVLENGVKDKVSKRPRKRLKPTTSQPDDYFEDTRNLEDLWKEAFPVGTEWDQLHLVYQYNWNFTNLENAFEEGGDLYGKKCYLFGCSEPQMVPIHGDMKITHVPAVVAVVSPMPPSDKIGISSVQREAEEIVPMKLMKMDWVPYIPFGNRDRMVERLKSEIFILRCTQRRLALKHLKEDRVKKFEYCLPYFYNPLKEEEIEQDTVVTILFTMEPNPIYCEFDWEFDELEDFADNLIKEEQLPLDKKQEFKDYVKKQVQEAKRTNREAREARKRTLEEMSEENKAALENIKFYKFYPVAAPDTPDLSQVKEPFINRYYGKAHQVL